MININFSSENFQYLLVKISIYLNSRVFVMCGEMTCSTCRRSMIQSYAITTFRVNVVNYCAGLCILVSAFSVHMYLLPCFN